MAYTIILQEKEEERSISVHNLSAAWGVLCGAIPAYAERYPTIRRFRQWWNAARQRDTIQKTVGGVTFQIRP